MDLGEAETLREAILGEAEDDLEFYITFPTPSGPSQDDDGFEFPIEEDGAPEPLVFVLGWAGSNDRDLAKYSRIYEERGCITVRYSAPGEYILFDTEKIQPLAMKLLDLVSELSLETSPIFFHCFSNSGATVVQFMMEAIKNDDRYKGLENRILGQVFDSAPGQRTASSFIGAYSYVWRSTNAFYRFIVPRMMLFYVIIMSMVKSIMAGIQGKIMPLFCYEYFMKETAVISPSLFIYSKSDSLFPAEQIDLVANVKEQAGCDVTRLCFDDSEHVNHLREHREVYISAVDQFLRKCLESRSRKQSTEN